MKRCIILLGVFSFLFVNVYGADDSKGQIYIEHNKGTDNHHLFIPDDEPDISYDSNSQVIVINGTGAVNYYHVVIMSMTTSRVVLSTTVNGTYDTISVSSLREDDYCVYIKTTYFNTYVYMFHLTPLGGMEAPFKR